ncbi:MAG: bifunctional phosphoribosyl-AMP cyclohydrolase/phosphoribosyl-ATP diphosphatase HisIE [Saprospiraceae bacterium]|nr:bifunctional phosphoribosyl-AMP cyclohydrolase/phosphoribosyl-ATP diphosphatase HisIE [Saprospiraceae bacterium]
MIDINSVNFKKVQGLLPVVVQSNENQVVLMLGYMNKEALEKTIQEKRVTFYSRTKQRLWTKGETSGNFLEVVNMYLDCDQDTLLILVNPKGNTCHKGRPSCFNYQLDAKSDKQLFLEELEAVIQDRQQNPKPNSYTNQLLARGINKVAQKVGEEAVELVIEAKDDNKKLFLGEAADLMYHYLLLINAKGYALEDVVEVLRERHTK